MQLAGYGSAIWVPLLLQVLLAVPLYGLTVAFGRVNVNRFSLHAVYRNRLVRAFLGSARPVRSPDPFTGFDPADNPRLADFRRPAAKQRCATRNSDRRTTRAARLCQPPPMPAWTAWATSGTPTKA